MVHISAATWIPESTAVIKLFKVILIKVHYYLHLCLVLIVEMTSKLSSGDSRANNLTTEVMHLKSQVAGNTLYTDDK